MGLDQYLTKRTYVKNWKHDEKDGVSKWKVSAKKYGKKSNIKPERISHVIEEITTWRKANAIHRWFVENVQDGNDDCGEYVVDREQLSELRDLCLEVIQKAEVKEGVVQNGSTFSGGEWTPNFESGEMIMNAEEISEILPTANGFFFGSTDYDQWYMMDIRNTYEVLRDELNEEKDNGWEVDYFYSSSW